MKFLGKAPIRIFEKQRDPNDPHLKNIVRPWNKKDLTIADIGIVGIPFDFGVELGGGRIGAADAPDEIRLQMKSYGTSHNPWHDADLSRLCIVDFGDIAQVAWDVKETHRRVTSVVQELIKKCRVLVVLGGGHDLTFATVSGLAQATGATLSGINVDAHLDVREVRDGLITSGTPFRRLIESGILDGSDLFEIGLQGQVNAKTYWEWAQKNSIQLYPLQNVREYPNGVKDVMESFGRWTEKLEALFVSIDIDSVAQAFAPGSSAPSPDGLFPQDILALAYEAGKISKVRLFEIMEVNPRFDQDNRTSRLAVNIILEFLAGYSKRKTI